METFKKNSEINIRDLLFYLFQRWRLLLICMVVGALVIGFYGWFSSSSDSIDLNDAAQVEASMTMEEIDSARLLARCIADYETRLDNLRWYIGNSDFMKLDPYNVTKGEIKFFVGADSQSGNEGINISRVQYYESLVSSADLSSIDMAYGDNVSTDTSEQKTGFFTVSVRDADQDTVEAVMREISDIVLNGNGNAEELLGKHDVTVVSSGVTTGYDAYVLKRQNESGELLESYTEQLKNETNLVDDRQKAYINYLVAEYKAGLSDMEAEPELIENSTYRHIDKKYIILGAFIGLVMAMIFIIIKYIADGKVHTSDDIFKTYGLAILGIFNGSSRFNKKHRTRFDLFLRKKRFRITGTNEEISATVAARVSVAAKQQGFKEVCFVIDSGVQNEEPFVNSIKDNLGSDVNITVLKDIVSDRDSITILSEYKNVFFIAQADCSKFRDINTEFSLCGKFGISMRGTILVD